MAKLESRIREMEIELGGVQSRTSECSKAYQKSERRIKELQFQQEEDKKNQDQMSELAQKLQQKIKTYKKSRSRRLRRSLPSTWPSSGRLSKSWRRPRTAPRWLRLSCLLPGLDLSVSCKQLHQPNPEKNLPSNPYYLPLKADTKNS